MFMMSDLSSFSVRTSTMPKKQRRKRILRSVAGSAASSALTGSGVGYVAGLLATPNEGHLGRQKLGTALGLVGGGAYGGYTKYKQLSKKRKTY